MKNLDYSQIQDDSNELIKNLPFVLHDYRFEKVIGRGHYSIVFEISNLKNNTRYAAKAINLLFSDSSKSTNVCDSEIEMLKKLLHPNIIKIYDYFRSGKHLFLILQLCEGGTITSLITPNSRFPIGALHSYMRQILEAFDYCHARNISHRDIKPENIFLDTYGRPLIGDFGFSIETSYDSYVGDSFCGSFIYKAPELIEKKPYCPLKADVFSLGVTFYTIAFGVLPWPRNNRLAAEKSIINCEYTFPDDCPPELAEVLRSMIVKDPDQRLTIKEILKLPFFTQFYEEIDYKVCMKNHKHECVKTSGSLPPLCYRQFDKKRLRRNSLLHANLNTSSQRKIYLASPLLNSVTCRKNAISLKNMNISTHIDGIDSDVNAIRSLQQMKF